MAKLKVFSAPEHIKEPVIDYANYNHQECQKQEQKYLDELKEFCLANIVGINVSIKYVGKIARFPVADGQAQYMVASQSPMDLIHLPLGDAWDFQYIESLGIKEIKQNIDSQERINKLFSKS